MFFEMNEGIMSPSVIMLSGPALALFVCVASLALSKAKEIRNRITYLLIAISGAFTTAAGVMGLLSPPQQLLLPLGLPWLPMHLRLDPLAGFFMVVIGLLVTSVGIYSVGYLRSRAKTQNLTLLDISMSLFIVGMQGVVLADDAYTFMIFWELMSVASYFFVIFDHEREANQKAGFLYLLMAHLGALLILSSFSILYAAGKSFEFEVMRNVHLSSTWLSLVFLTAGLGFGLKAGIIPLHIWLPEAHPVAPSNASALMSGVMIKVAVFGFLRVIWDLVGLDQAQGWWGGLVLAAGSSSAVGGVLLALQQHNLKRLLAYHSVENIGIIAIGLGLAMIFAHFGHRDLAALGLVAALYHTLNHALFKGLLFMGAGAILHATHHRNLDHLGGLIRRMPVTAVLFLIGCISISALPPFNGFVSEWLTFQAALMAPKLENSPLAALIPFSAAMLALAGALTATCFIKVFGIIFQGTPRTRSVAEAHEVDGWMLSGMALPAVLCLILGISPVWVIPLIDQVSPTLLASNLERSLTGSHWLWLTPLSPERASYSPLIVLLTSLLAGLAAFLLHRRGKPVRRAPVWSCGHPDLNPRMQYTATSFSQPLRRIFSTIYQPHEEVSRLDHGNPLLVKRIRFSVHIQDLAWNLIYSPARRTVEWLTRGTDWLQRRQIHGHLSLVFVTLLILLGFLI